MPFAAVMAGPTLITDAALETLSLFRTYLAPVLDSRVDGASPMRCTVVGALLDLAVGTGVLRFAEARVVDATAMMRTRAVANDVFTGWASEWVLALTESVFAEAISNALSVMVAVTRNAPHLEPVGTCPAIRALTFPS